MAPRFETARDSPKLKEKSKQVEDLEAQVNALKVKESALGYPAQIYPAEQQLSKSQYYPGVQHDAIAGGGYGLQAMRGGGGDARAWYDQQKRVITAELQKERLALREKLASRYDLQRQQSILQAEEMKLRKLEEMQLKREVRLRTEMDYRAKVGKKEDIMIVTTAKGYRIKDVCGAVMGFGLINAIYEEEEEEHDFEEELMLSPHVARVEAVEHMISDAQRCHANAVVSFQWIIRPLDAERTKVLAQGTAVVIERDGPAQCGECGTVKKKQKGDGGKGGSENKKGNFIDHEHSQDFSTFSGGGPSAINTLKQKGNQQQQQKGKGGGGAGAGAGGKNSSEQGRKNKGKQNNHSKQSDNDNDERRPDDDNDNDNNDDSLKSDADEDDNHPLKSKQQQGKGKGQNNQNPGSHGGGAGKGGKGQKLTPAQQIVKLLAEAKIREDRHKTEETEKERLYKHMETFFKDRNNKSGGWGGSSSKELTTMDWLKKIEQEIEERNKKQNGGKGRTSSSTCADSSGWGNDNSKSKAGSVGWGDTTDDPTKTSEDNGKDKQRDRKNNNISNTSGSGNQSKKQDAWNTDDSFAQATQTAPQQDTAAGWGDTNSGQAQTQSAGDAWADDIAGPANNAGGTGDAWGGPTTSGENTSAAPGGGWV